jgi:putative transcriptional regulator
MPIRVKLDHLMLDRRITLTTLASRVGLTLANLSILKTNKARAIRFSTLDALCRELNCQPGDRLVWTPEDDAAESSMKSEVAPPDEALK